MQWLKSIIKPISKPGGDPLNPSDYRGISLQSVIMKVFCCILNARLGEYLEDNHLLAEEQNGFRKERGCIDHLFTLCNIVESRRCLGKDTFACFVDFSKAFDSVNRMALWHKIEHRFGISGPFLNLIKSLYDNVESAVKVNNDLTDWFEIQNGVKQGCILSPTLFSMFINDLAEDINTAELGVQCKENIVSSLLFADDLVILAENEVNLQGLLNILSNWCDKWGIKINSSKTKCMHFRNKRKLCSVFHFEIGEFSPDYTHQYKYLGFWINEFLDNSESTQKVYDHANRALGVLIAKSKSAGGLPMKVFSHLFDTLVLSRIEYTAAIWACRSFPLLNQIQHNALRFFFGLGKTAPIAALIGDSGWIPLQMYLQYTVLKFWLRACSLPPNRLVRKIFIWASEIADQGKNNWVSRTRDLLEKIHIEHQVDGTLSVKELQGTIWYALGHHFFDKWREDVWSAGALESESGGKLVLYRQFKCMPELEPYAKAHIPLAARRVLAGLRAGCLPLQVELGRFTCPKTPYEQRLCKLCGEAPEDQTHFLLMCPKLREPRVALFKSVSKKYQNFITEPISKKLSILLHPQEHLYCILMGIYNLYTCRQKLIFNQ